MIRRSSDSRQLIGGKGNYAPASASDNLPFLLKIASTPEGFGGKGIRTPDFQLAKLAHYQLSYAPAFRIAECRLAIADFNPESFRSWVPAFLIGFTATARDRLWLQPEPRRISRSSASVSVRVLLSKVCLRKTGP